MSKLTTFVISGKSQAIRYIETLQVKEGVECDTYTIIDDPTKDLAIVRVQGGYKTPLQRILKGRKTIEGFLDGQATLVITSPDSKSHMYRFDTKTDRGKEVIVALGQTMQWIADQNADLVFYEICEPPYEDGRFENISE